MTNYYKTKGYIKNEQGNQEFVDVHIDEDDVKELASQLLDTKPDPIEPVEWRPFYTQDDETFHFWEVVNNQRKIIRCLNQLIKNQP